MKRLEIVLVVFVLGATSVALSAPQGRGGPQSLEHADRFIVSFDGSARDLQADVRALRGRIDWLHGGAGLAKVSRLSDEGAAALAARTGVISVTRDLILQMVPPAESLLRDHAPLPAGAAAQGHDPTAAVFFPFQWNMQIIDADDAWNAGFSGSPSVRVAVIDTGIDPFHIDMAGLIDAGNSIAFTPSTNPAGPPWGDDHFHGTHVAGTVVTNGIGTSGVAPHTTLIAIKAVTAAGTGSLADVIAGILHAADAGADVINMSLGIGIPANLPGAGLAVAAFNKAVNYANGRGALLVSAAGNDGVDLGHIGNIAVVPCESGAGICVSATGPTDQIASYSNFGSSVINLSAPGGDFVVTETLASMVLGPCSTLTVIPDLAVCQANGLYLFVEGTSLATPHVSGVAALVDAQYGGALNGGQLGSRLQVTADDLGKPGADPLFGHGRVNALQAVLRAY